MVLEVVATYQLPVHVINDFNIYFDRPDDSNTCHLLDIVRSFRFDVCLTVVTHQLGGMIDAVITRQDLLCPFVQTVDVGLSDHYFLE